MTRDADVVIVGGGPAGSMAALALADRGVHAVLLDKKRFPRDKPCGGGIRASLFRRFPRIADDLRKRVAIHEIHKVLMESPSGASVLAESDVPFYVTLERTEFDAALLGLAREHGVDVTEGTRVCAVERNRTGMIVRSIDGRAFAAQVVIGADGVNSIVAREAGLTAGFTDDALAIDTMEETDPSVLGVADPDTMYVAYGYKGYPGYGYVFPKARCVDAGVGFLLSFFKKSLSGSPYDHHRTFLAEARAKGIVRGDSVRENFKAYRLPLGGPLARTYAERLLVCGDAGGFVNGYTGEGIYHAMVSGELAGETAAAAVRRGDCSAAALADYQIRWRREIGDELVDSLRIQRRLFANPRLADAIIEAARTDRKLCRLFAQVALGEERLRRRKFEMTWRFAVASLRVRLQGFRRRLGLAPARS